MVAVKLWRVVKVCAVTRPTGIKLTTASSAGMRNGLIMGVFGVFMDVSFIMQWPFIQSCDVRQAKSLKCFSFMADFILDSSHCRCVG